MTAVDAQALPAVFQQAISIARKLRVQYIWIDSLCIVQDNKQDWELESSKMCDYYENSYLTIATAASPNCDVPFLRPKEEKWRPVKFALGGKEKNGETINAQRSPYTPKEQGILFTRAWAWQEAALSSRTIYFTPSELIWECREHVLPQRYLPDLDISEKLEFSKRLSMIETMTFDGDNISHLWDLVGTLVSAYSSRRLTVPTDKLPALSGVASRIQKMTNSRYVAGLWEDNLIYDLCWSIHFQPLQYVPPTYVAPSWSWASITQAAYAEISQTRVIFESQFTVLETHTEVDGLNPFGRVSKGHVLVRGRCAYVELGCDNPFQTQGYTISRLDDKEDKCAFLPDCVLQATLDPSGDSILSRARNGQDVSKFKVEALCLYLGVSTLRNELDIRTRYGLILGPSEEEGGSFCRLGFVFFHGDCTDLFQESSEKEFRII
ncbi:hypothetical protein PFICI_00951 [Pestalotiopsis fici W106-1]|uniref:Heterokaryon incompatibility domain-containing protein n=1 Tax=Pestalotiopsis fici (strain W106-1 / CGMCC3.15140) TaxID=1229662 RepID=W3XM43_PESFW|nr:uncharacterized protein PFICI_00951 [Pestalotiopsis fici W106-1]ETS87123.1 hypothetical protein PFICI_00951 [Pestalotiopsis fici W106-1]